jgi:hypothetical protein
MFSLARSERIFPFFFDFAARKSSTHFKSELLNHSDTNVDPSEFSTLHKRKR